MNIHFHLAHAIHFYPNKVNEINPNILQLSDLDEQASALEQMLSDPRVRELRQLAKVEYYRILHQHFPENFV